jgi:hypothetical protein
MGQGRSVVPLRKTGLFDLFAFVAKVGFQN